MCFSEQHGFKVEMWSKKRDKFCRNRSYERWQNLIWIVVLENKGVSFITSKFRILKCQWFKFIWKPRKGKKSLGPNDSRIESIWCMNWVIYIHCFTFFVEGWKHYYDFILFHGIGWKLRLLLSLEEIPVFDLTVFNMTERNVFEIWRE